MMHYNILFKQKFIKVSAHTTVVAIVEVAALLLNDNTSGRPNKFLASLAAIVFTVYTVMLLLLALRATAAKGGI